MHFHKCYMLNQLLGMSSLVATIVELIYMITHKDSFTQFEYFFFFMVSWTKVVGELTLLYNGLMILRDLGGSRNVLKALTKDPAHILAGAKATTDTTEEEHELTLWALIAFLVSNGSVYIWAIFLPVWYLGSTGDKGLRLALSVISFGLVLPFLYVFFIATRLGDIDNFGSTRFKLIFSLVSLIYTMEKTFELYILLSNKQRLMVGTVGELLVGFQVLEILSVAVSVFYVWMPKNNQNSKVEELDGPQWGILRRGNTQNCIVLQAHCDLEGGHGG